MVDSANNPLLTLTTRENVMPFARIDLIKGKPPEYRATVADIVYEGIVGVLKAPDGDRLIVINEHEPANLIYDRHFLDMDRSPDFMLIQVTSTVGNTEELKLAFYRRVADQLNSKLGVRPDDIMINMVFVKREDWSFGRGQPW
ncbi:MAG TPA: tautomerase family protein [Roseiarcus sp.]